MYKIYGGVVNPGFFSVSFAGEPLPDFIFQCQRGDFSLFYLLTATTPSYVSRKWVYSLLKSDFNAIFDEFLWFLSAFWLYSWVLGVVVTICYYYNNLKDSYYCQNLATDQKSLQKYKISVYFWQKSKVKKRGESNRRERSNQPRALHANHPCIRWWLVEDHLSTLKYRYSGSARFQHQNDV